MKLTVQVKLLTDAKQSISLLATMKAFNEAASFAARVGFDAKVFSPPSIQKLCYQDLRARFKLSAQMAIRAIGKAAEVFRRDKTICPVFKPTGAMTYDERILSWKGIDKVSILTLSGRVLVSFVCGEYQRGRLDRLKGQVDLVYRDGAFYLYATVDLPEDPLLEVKDFIGVDLGIVNIATADDGTAFSGKATDTVRKRSARARQTYQRKGTRSARRYHDRITVRHTQRSRHSNWSFHQLRTFLTYKAKLAGVPLVAVDPRNTSRTCSECGHCDKGNRKSQGHFECLACGFVIPADQNGARNIRLRALGVNVNHPDLVAAPAN